MEEWRAIKGYEGLYEVSNYGRLKSLARKDSLGRQSKERILKCSVNNSGYLRIALCKDGVNKQIQIHQLVAIYFLGHKPNGHKIVVDHINGDKLNNKVENLQVITNRANLSKDKKGGSSKYVGVSWNNASKKWQSRILIDGNRRSLGYFKDELEASRAYQSALNELV